MTVQQLLHQALQAQHPFDISTSGSGGFEPEPGQLTMPNSTASSLTPQRRRINSEAQPPTQSPTPKSEQRRGVRQSFVAFPDEAATSTDTLQSIRALSHEAHNLLRAGGLDVQMAESYSFENYSYKTSASPPVANSPGSQDHIYQALDSWMASMRGARRTSTNSTATSTSSGAASARQPALDLPRLWHSLTADVQASVAQFAPRTDSEERTTSEERSNASPGAATATLQPPPIVAVDVEGLAERIVTVIGAQYGGTNPVQYQAYRTTAHRTVGASSPTARPNHVPPVRIHEIRRHSLNANEFAPTRETIPQQRDTSDEDAAEEDPLSPLSVLETTHRKSISESPDLGPRRDTVPTPFATGAELDAPPLFNTESEIGVLVRVDTRVTASTPTPTASNVEPPAKSPSPLIQVMDNDGGSMTQKSPSQEGHMITAGQQRDNSSGSTQTGHAAIALSNGYRHSLKQLLVHLLRERQKHHAAYSAWMAHGRTKGSPLQQFPPPFPTNAMVEGDLSPKVQAPLPHHRARGRAYTQASPVTRSPSSSPLPPPLHVEVPLLQLPSPLRRQLSMRNRSESWRLQERIKETRRTSLATAMTAMSGGSGANSPAYSFQNTPRETRKTDVAQVEGVIDPALDDGWSLNQYVVLQQLGQGNQAEVWLAYDTLMNDMRALKLVKRPPPEYSSPSPPRAGRHRQLMQQAAAAEGVAPSATAITRSLSQHGRFDSMRAAEPITPRETLDYSPRPAGAGLSVVRQRARQTIFDREIEMTERCQHRHTVRLYEVINDPSKPHVYLVLQHCERKSIASMKANGTIAPEEMHVPSKVALYCYQIARALTHIHRIGIVHRDVKPDNILLGSGELACLSDFGMAEEYANYAKLRRSRTLAPNSDQTRHLDDDVEYDEHDPRSPERSQPTRGTITFLSPEQLRIETPVVPSLDSRPRHFRPTPAIDVWAFGVTLYALLEGHLPWRITTRGGVIDQILSAQISFDDNLDEDDGAAAARPHDDEPQDEREARIALRAVIQGVLKLEPSQRLKLPEIKRMLAKIVRRTSDARLVAEFVTDSDE
jgi:serine/threonine protein kinase